MAQHLLKPTAKPGTFVHLLERDPRTHAVRFEIEAAFNREARLNATRVRITNDGTKCSFVDCRFGVSATIDIDPKRLSRARQLELLRTTVQRLDPQTVAALGAVGELLAGERAQLIATNESLAKSLAALTSSMTPNELRGARGPIAGPTLVTVAGTSEAGVARPMPGVQTLYEGHVWKSTIKLYNAEGESVGVAKWSESMAEWVIFPDPDNPELEKSKADFHREAAQLLEARRHHEREAAAARGAVEALTRSVQEQTRYMQERDAERDAMRRLRRTIDRELAGALELVDAHGVRTDSHYEYATLPLTTMRALRSLLDQIRTECGTAGPEIDKRDKLALAEADGRVLDPFATAPDGREIPSRADAPVVHLEKRGVRVDFTVAPELKADLAGTEEIKPALESMFGSEC